MSKAILDANYDWRRKTEFHREDGKVYIRTAQDCQGIADMAHALSDEKPGKDFRLVALIPMEVLNKALLEGWANDQDAWKRWANDSVNKDFRVWKGSL